MAEVTFSDEFIAKLFNMPRSSRPSITAQAQQYKANKPDFPTGSTAVMRDKTGRVQGPFRPDLPEAVRDSLERGRRILRERSGAGPVPEPYPPIQRQLVQPVQPAENTPGMSEFVDVYTPFPLVPAGSPAQSEFIGGPTPLPFPIRQPNDSSGSFINGGAEIDADNIAISLLQDLPANPATRAANQVTADVAKGLKHGGDTAQYQNQKGLINEASDTISGLLGNVDFKGLFRVLARPEFVAPMGPGQTPLTNFVNAAAADRTAQAATRAAQQTAGLEGFKAETDRLKALMPDPSKMPKLTGEVNKMYDRIESSRRIASVGNKIKAALVKSPFATGGTGEASKAVRAIAAAFGISPGVFTSDDVTKNVAKLKGEVLKSKTFGREASRQELEEILNKILASPSLFTTSDQILDSVDSLMRDAERDLFNTTARLKAYGLHTSTDKNPMTLPTKYFDRNNQGQK